MKKLLHNIISKLCFASFLGIIVSCTTDDFSENRHYNASEVGGEVNLSLNVSIAGASGIGKTRDGEETEDNKYYFEDTDNEYERIKTLRIIIVRPDYTVEANKFINLTTPVSTLTNAVLKEDPLAEEDGLKFRLSTTQGYVDNEAMTCTEKKRVFLIANEATLDKFQSNIAETGNITKLLKELAPPYYPPKEEVDEAKKEGKDIPLANRGDKLDPYKVEKWIIYNEWSESGDAGTDVNDLLAKPIINNEVPDKDKSYIPMTEFFDIDVVSTWKPKPTDSGSGSGSSSGSGSGNGSGSGGNDNQVIDNDYLLKVIPEQTADLFVTRNFVKFQFEVESIKETFKINKITFKNLMWKEYMFPFDAKYKPGKYPVSSEDREIIDFKIPGYADNYTRKYEFLPENFGIVSEGFTIGDRVDLMDLDHEYKPQLYFCETKNFETNGESDIYKVGIDITFFNSDGTSQDIVFEPQELNNLPSIPRNTLVKVKFVINEREVICNVTLLPYTGVWLNPIFGI